MRFTYGGCFAGFGCLEFSLSASCVSTVRVVGVSPRGEPCVQGAGTRTQTHRLSQVKSSRGQRLPEGKAALQPARAGGGGARGVSAVGSCCS